MITNNEQQPAEESTETGHKKEIDALNQPFDMYGKNAWADEIRARKAIRSNLNDLVQTLDTAKSSAKYGENVKFAVRRCKQREDKLTQFCVDYPDGTYISIVFDPLRKFPKPERDDAGKHELPTFVKRFDAKDSAVNKKVINRKMKKDV